MRRLFAGVELLYAGEKKPAHGDDGLVADAEMFPAAVEDRAHAFRGARVMIEKILDAGEIYLLLYLAVLEIIITRVTNPGVVGVDLFAPVHLVVEHGAVAAKADIVAPAVRVVGRHVGMDFIAFQFIGWPARRHAAVNRHDEGGETDVVLVVEVARGD